MIKPIFSIIAVCCLCANFAYAKPFQNEVSGLEAYSLQSGSFHIDFSSGLTFPFTDVNQMVVKPAFELMGGYYFQHGLSVQVSLLKGWMAAGVKNDEDRYFMNNYWSENLILRFNPMAIWRTQTNSRPNFYVGAGVSLMQSYTIGQYRPGTAGGYKANYHGHDIFIPGEIGVNIPLANVNKRSDNLISQFLVLNINYRNYFSFTDDMDSYVPPAKYSKHNDGFSVFSLGLSFVF